MGVTEQRITFMPFAYDVAAESHEHLRRCLSADSAAREVVLREEIGVHARPVVGDGVAHEHHVGRRGEFGVGLGVTSELGPVLLLSRNAQRGDAHGGAK